MHDDVCEPEFIDGRYYGCGACDDCIQREHDDAEADAELGDH